MIYRPYLYEIEKSEKIFGEHSAAGYALPFDINIVIEVKDAPSWIEAAGINNDENVTAWIHINTFRRQIDAIINNPSDNRYQDYTKIYKDFDHFTETPPHGAYTHMPEPKPGDVIQLTKFGIDRPWDRGDRMWIITNVEDEIISENFNEAFGHYLWKLTAKRFRYSYQDGMSTLDEKTRNDVYLGIQGEKGNRQIYDTRTVIKNEYKDGELFDTKEYKRAYHRDDSDDESRHIFDMSRNVANFYDDQENVQKNKANDDFPDFEDNGWL